MKKGGAGRGQGRKKGSQNVKGNFDASLPPVRCKQALYDTIEALANAEGKSMSTWMREQLETITSNNAFAGDFDGAGQVSGVSISAEASPSRA